MKLTLEQQACIVAVFRQQEAIISQAQAVMTEAIRMVATRLGLDPEAQWSVQVKDGEMFLEDLTPQE